MTEDPISDRALHALLDGYAASEPSAALRGRIVSAAPRERSVGRAWRWIAGAGLGLGFAASAAAGVAAGYTLGPPAVTRLMGPSELDAGAFSAIADPVDGLGDG
jgi:hypothetical protein